eukprot:UN09964
MGSDFCNCNLPKPEETNLDKVLFLEEKRKLQKHRNASINPEESSHIARNEPLDHPVNVTENEDDGEPSYSNNSSLIHPIDMSVSINSNISESYIHDQINWTKESLEWYKIDKMTQLSQFINYYQRTHLSLQLGKKHPIWTKFDVNYRNKLKTQKYLPQLLYSYLYLLLKSQHFNSTPPKFKQLRSVLCYYSDAIIQIMPAEQKIFLQKDHF